MKKYIYILPPLILTLLFGVIYYNFHQKHEAKTVARLNEKKALNAKKIEDQRLATLKAMDDQLIASENAKKAKAERELREQKEFETREAARLAREKAKSDLNEVEAREQALIAQMAELEINVQDLEKRIASVKKDQDGYVALAKETKTQEAGWREKAQKIKDAEDIYRQKIAELAAAAAQKK